MCPVSNFGSGRKRSLSLQNKQTNKNQNNNNKKQQQKNNFMKYLGKWMDLENIILSEVTQS